jgi:outer membrane lipoprotein-sorting protein
MLMLKRWLMLMVVLAVTTGLTGCLSTTRLVQKTRPPEIYRSTSVETLEKEVSDRDAAIKTLNAQVLITASVGGSKEGKVTEYTSFKGYIFVQKPDSLRVILQVPVLGSRALDMVSGGGAFTMVHAARSGPDVWMQGTNVVTKPSKNGLENLRPPVFLDSLLIPGVSAEDYVSLTNSNRVIQPVGKHQDAIDEPDYDLTISKTVSGHILRPERVIHISRVTMLPFQQDIYDEQGRVVTQATYENYQKNGDQQFPMLINIRRPLDEYSLKIVVTKLTLNEPFDADQFELKIPEGVTVQKIE